MGPTITELDVPNQAHVNFGPSLDVLLAAVIKLRKGQTAIAEPGTGRDRFVAANI